MPTLVIKLDEENWQSLHNLALGIYLDGACYEFAAALHRGLNWPLVGLMREDTIWHALVRTPTNLLRDVRGELKPDDCGDHFGLSRPYTFFDVTETDLHNTRLVHEESIERASLMAEALWPELPWRDRTLHKRARLFVNELEILCKKHGVWIRAPYPTAKIVLAKSCGFEGGFEMYPTLDGQYFIDRYFPS